MEATTRALVGHQVCGRLTGCPASAKAEAVDRGERQYGEVPCVRARLRARVRGLAGNPFQPALDTCEGWPLRAVVDRLGEDGRSRRRWVGLLLRWHGGLASPDSRQSLDSACLRSVRRGAPARSQEVASCGVALIMGESSAEAELSEASPRMA